MGFASVPRYSPTDEYPKESRGHLHHLRSELSRVEALGGEGLMLRQPALTYEVGRSYTLLKVKSFQDSEAVVVGHQPGAGRHRGRLGALLVELADGTRFSVGTGFSDAEREAPPSIGSTITFRYQELSDGGYRDSHPTLGSEERLPLLPRRSQPPQHSPPPQEGANRPGTSSSLEALHRSSGRWGWTARR